MLNDAVCFKAVYIVCGYTDLRSGMDRLAALVEAQTGNSPYVPDTLPSVCVSSRPYTRIQNTRLNDAFSLVYTYPSFLSMF